MKAVWVGIYDRGNLAMERVHFRALADIDLSYLAVLDTRMIDAGRIFVGSRGCHWFIPQRVKAGDNIVLYTRAGNPSVEKRPDGNVFHFIFRGLPLPLYPHKDDTAVLFELNSWATCLPSS